MKLGIIDCETTGIDLDAEICEVAITVYHVGNKHWQSGAIASFSSLIATDKTNDAQDIHGITAELLESASPYYERSISTFTNLVDDCEHCVAFNAEFDSKKLLPILGERSWICAMRDLDWNFPKVNAYGNFRLIDLALWLGIGISTHHRAGDDVRLLVECFNRIPNLKYLIDSGIERAKSPILEIQALVSYENRELAKNAGFSWDGNRKMWLKNIKEIDFPLLAVDFSCKTLKVNGEMV